MYHEKGKINPKKGPRKAHIKKILFCRILKVTATVACHFQQQLLLHIIDDKTTKWYLLQLQKIQRKHGKNNKMLPREAVA